MRVDHAKNKENCMTRSFGHGQPVLQVFETPITLNVVESVKCFFNPTGSIFVSLTHIKICIALNRHSPFIKKMYVNRGYGFIQLFCSIMGSLRKMGKALLVAGYLLEKGWHSKC